jgi:hypothetical protein
MTIEDTRPLEDTLRLRKLLAEPRPRLRGSGLWRHRCKNGELMQVDVRGEAIDYEGLPGKYLVLNPLNYLIVTASDEYLESAMTTRDGLRGRHMFEALPGGEDPSDANTPENLRNLLARSCAQAQSRIAPAIEGPFLLPARARQGVLQPSRVAVLPAKALRFDFGPRRSLCARADIPRACSAPGSSSPASKGQRVPPSVATGSAPHPSARAVRSVRISHRANRRPEESARAKRRT